VYRPDWCCDRELPDCVDNAQPSCHAGQIAIRREFLGMAPRRVGRTRPDHLTRREQEPGTVVAILAAATILDGEASPGVNRLRAKLLAA
jgi:hypothetical protein